MNIVILDTCYEFFLSEFYRARSKKFEPLSYQHHLEELMSYRFSASDAFSHAFKEEGCRAQEIVFNDNRLQLKWAREHGLRTITLPSFPAKALNVITGWDWRFDVLRAQIKSIQPDVIYIKEQSLLTDAMVKELKSMGPLIAMQVGSRLLKRRTYAGVDLAFTSFPHFVPLFRKMGLEAFYQKLCFDPRVLNEMGEVKKEYPVTFVGGITHHQHQLRNELLELTCREFPFRWFGYTTSPRHQSRDLLACREGSVWGLDLYRALASSQVTINIHGEIAGPYANNVRLYEAAGVGTCLLTDEKDNIRELFEPDKEVVTYRGKEDYREKLEFLIERPESCAEIGAAAQKRVLAEHTFKHRVRELIPVFKKYYRP